MKNASKHVALYQDSNIILNALKYELELQGIPVLIKNNTESGRLAGFVAGSNSNVLYVSEEDLNEAENVLDSFLEKKD